MLTQNIIKQIIQFLFIPSIYLLNTQHTQAQALTQDSVDVLFIIEDKETHKELEGILIIVSIDKTDSSEYRIKGKKRIQLKANSTYTVLSKSQNHFSYSTQYTTTKLIDTLRITLQLIEVNICPVLDDAYFEKNTSKIDTSSLDGAKTIIWIFQEYGSILSTIEITGHCSNDEKDVSLNRAKAVKQYLISNGIPSSMIKIFGKGSKYPLYNTSNKETNAKNRRVEFKLISKE